MPVFVLTEAVAVVFMLFNFLNHFSLCFLLFPLLYANCAECTPSVFAAASPRVKAEQQRESEREGVRVGVGERCSSEKNQTNLGKEIWGRNLPPFLSLSHVTHTHNASSADAGAARLGQFTRRRTTTKSTWKKSICVLECVFYHTHACIILDLIRCY